jgi:hypothetical protein
MKGSTVVTILTSEGSSPISSLASLRAVAIPSSSSSSLFPPGRATSPANGNFPSNGNFLESFLGMFYKS